MNKTVVQTDKSRKIIYILRLALAVLAVVALILSLLWGALANRSLQTLRQQKEEEERRHADEAAVRLSAAQKEADALREQIERISAELAILKADTTHQLLSDEIVRLEQELAAAVAEYEGKLTELNTLLAEYQTVYAIDVVAQGRIIGELLTLLEDGAPQRVVPPEPPEEPAPGEPGETGEPQDPPEPEYIDARVALYYQDLDTGYTFAYNENEVFSSASLVKLSYVWSLLKRVSAEEELAQQRAAAYKAESLANWDSEEDPETVEWPEYIFEDPKYDLSDTVVLDKETMMREGSGVIQYMEDGTVFTYRELVAYTLKKSDNIAFALLYERFGFTDYYKDAVAIGIKTVTRQGFYRMTAKEWGLVLKTVYDFIETDARYGSFMKECMVGSGHSVMIPYAVYPTPVAHKYGWDTDAYHDIGIVYHDKPYLLVFLSDLDEGSYSSEVSAYVRQVLSLVHKLHTNFYKK